mgnify:CR=1 FL=1
MMFFGGAQEIGCIDLSTGLLDGAVVSALVEPGTPAAFALLPAFRRLLVVSRMPDQKGGAVDLTSGFLDELVVCLALETAGICS